MGWTGVDMSTPLSSGRYLFPSKNDIKIVRYTFWPSILSLFQPRPQGLLSYWDGDEKALASAGHLSNLIGCCFSHKLYTI